MPDHVTSMQETTLSGAEGRAKLQELLKGIRIAMLTTVGEDGAFRSRPMATQDTEFDGTLYFLTKVESEKVEEIRDHSQVLLTYADTGASKYVILRGQASVFRDQAIIDRLWNPMAKAWFPQGKEDPSIAVVRVYVTDAEYWDANASKVVRYVKMALAAATDRMPDMGDHGHIKLAS